MEFIEDPSFEFRIDPYILRTRNYHEIQAFVEAYFREYDLRFSLLEMSLLNEGVGEILIFGDPRNADLEGRYTEYINLVKKFENSVWAPGGVSSYEEWYSRRSIWYKIAQGKSPNLSMTVDNSEYEWLEKAGGRVEFSRQLKRGLSEEQLRTYLNNYLGEIVDFELGKYPYYSIIIKSLGYWDKNRKEMRSLGNLYLHFATEKPIHEGFLSGFLKDFLIVWYKNYGGILVDELRRRATDENKNQKPDYLFEMPDEMKPAKRNKIVQLLAEAYTDCLAIIEEQDNILKKQFLPFLLTQREMGNDVASQGKTWEAFKKYYKNKRYTENRGINSVCEVLAVRRAIFLMHILFDYSLVEIHAFLRSGNIREKHNGDGGTIYSYFLERFITGLIKAIEPDTNRKTEMYQAASQKERQFLKECLDLIHQTLPEEQRGKYSLPAEI